jgi:hypothetical protein
MRIIGCDLHARQQTLAMLDTTTGEVVEMAADRAIRFSDKTTRRPFFLRTRIPSAPASGPRKTLLHEGNYARELYSKLPGPVRVGIEATGSMQWFVNLMEELGIECLVGHPAAPEAET